MSGQAKITLRPPPNVEFVQGYPGIPPAAPDRPQAAVKGTIELRLGNQGAKAKWVRIELRKVETLPGGGQSNTFYDYVGQSPITIWQAQEEWGFLHTQDFPFFIRIPESIPPSITLERGAGIKYELIATVCLKGKRGFFRRAASMNVSTMAPIILDKHELHSTWPIYGQPNSRSGSMDNLTLTVDRLRTCYGPADKVIVTAILKSDNISTVVLRAFEFELKETIIFRGLPHVSGKKGAPQVKVTTIGEQKVPVNASIFGGTQHKAELGCIIPVTHTTATVNAARHIDIAYSIIVKAVLGSGKPLLMELPVTVSNWPRATSIEAVKRIGPSPNLSLIPSSHLPRPALAQTVSRPGETIQSPTSPVKAQQPQMRTTQTMPNRPSDFGPPSQSMHSTSYTDGRANGRADEFGFAQPPAANGPPATFGGLPARDIPVRQGTQLPPDNESVSAHSRRSRSANAAVPTNRLTVTNHAREEDEDDLDELPQRTSNPISAPASALAPPAPPPSQRYKTAEEEKRDLQRAFSAGAPVPKATPPAPIPAAAPAQTTKRPTTANSITKRPGTANSATSGPWLSAEEEKARFENARAAVAHTQGGNFAPHMMPPASSSPSGGYVDGGRVMASPMGPIPGQGSSSLNANDEKERMKFEQAQAAVRRTRGVDGGSPPPMNSSYDPPRINSNPVNVQLSSNSGAELYQRAMSAVSRNSAAQGAGTSSRPTPPNPSSVSRLPTAEEEKAALRYYEAKQQAEYHQQQAFVSSTSVPSDAPISYDALYPSGPSSKSQDASSYSKGGYSQMNGFSKDGRGDMGSSSFLLADTPPDSPPPPPAPALPLDARTEKERLRRMYEQQDQAGSGPPPPPMPPTHARGPSIDSMAVGPPSAYPRSQPSLPLMPVGRPLNAAEEKARLRAQYEAEEREAQALAGGYGGPPPPPPARSSTWSDAEMTRVTSLIAPPPPQFYDEPGSMNGVNGMYGGMNGINGMRGMNGFDGDSGVGRVGPPPPLMPRPPVEYIQETQAEDARSQAEDHAFLTTDPAAGRGHRPQLSETTLADNSQMDFGLSVQPFSPLQLALDKGSPQGQQPNGSLPPPPPLPPKVPIDD